MSQIYDQVCNEPIPAGERRLVTTCWEGYQVYAVQANWSDAASQVFAYGDGDLYSLGKQVADFRHKPEKALRHVLELAAAYSDDDESEAIESALDRAESF